MAIAMMITHIGRKRFSYHVKKKVSRIQIEASSNDAVVENKCRAENAPGVNNLPELKRELHKERSKSDKMAEPECSCVR